MLNAVETLRSLLANNIVRFTFRKVDGTIRYAVGTRNLDIARAKTGVNIPTPKGEEQPYSYYDVEKMGWRSYKPENLISIDNIVPVEYVDLREPVKKEIAVELPPSFGKGTEEKIRKEFARLGGDIKDIPVMPIGGGKTFGMPVEDIEDVAKDIVRKAKGTFVGTPVPTNEGIGLPVGDINIDDFAKLMAKYVVAEFISRLSK